MNTTAPKAVPVGQAKNRIWRRQAAVLLGAPLIAALGAFGYARWITPAPLPADVRADRVLVLKSQRKLILLRNSEPLREYRVALGFNAVGPKEREGDGRTPEGLYAIDYRNPASQFHYSLHVSYPKATDVALARKQGVEPGGMIMIHGLRSGLGLLAPFHFLTDWTNGCIAVGNREIDEIARAVPDGTPIEIRP